MRRRQKAWLWMGLLAFVLAMLLPTVARAADSSDQSSFTNQPSAPVLQNGVSGISGQSGLNGNGVSSQSGSAGSASSAGSSGSAGTSQASQSASGSSTVVPDVNRYVDTQQMNDFWQALNRQYGAYLPGGQSPSLFDTLRSGDFSLKGICIGLLSYLFHEVVQNSKLLGTIILLAVFAAILENIQSAFEENAVSKVAFAVSYLVLIVLAVQSFTSATNFAKQAIQSMVDFMMATIPLMLALLASTGSIASVAMIHPLIVFTIDSFSELIEYVIFPLIFFSAILDIVSALSDKYQVTRLASFLRASAVGLLGIFFSIFLGVVSVKGAAAAVTDGITLRTAKYISSTFIPVIGKMFSDAAETVVGASLLVKNAVGIAGMLILLLICAFPAIKILSLAIIYNFSSALLQPLGNTPIITCLSIMGKSLILVFAALATVGLMFFLAITILVAAGNLTMMMR